MHRFTGLTAINIATIFSAIPTTIGCSPSPRRVSSGNRLGFRELRGASERDRRGRRLLDTHFCWLHIRQPTGPRSSHSLGVAPDISVPSMQHEHPTAVASHSRALSLGEACALPVQIGSTGRFTPLEDVHMKVSHVSAFARAARMLALAAVATGRGAVALLAQGSTGKIEGRVRDQAGAPIANAQVFIVGTAFNSLTNPQGYYFINNVPAGDDLGPRRLHRVQVDPGERRQGAGRPDRHGGHPAGADGRSRSRRSPSSPRPSRWCRATRSPRSSGSTACSPTTSRSTG